VVPSCVEEVDQVLQTETTKLSGLAFAVCAVGQLCFPEMANPVSQSCDRADDSWDLLLLKGKDSLLNGVGDDNSLNFDRFGLTDSMDTIDSLFVARVSAGAAGFSTFDLLHIPVAQSHCSTPDPEWWPKNEKPQKWSDYVHFRLTRHIALFAIVKLSPTPPALVLIMITRTGLLGSVKLEMVSSRSNLDMPPV
jgi:hypothetical protein